MEQEEQTHTNTQTHTGHPYMFSDIMDIKSRNKPSKLELHNIYYTQTFFLSTVSSTSFFKTVSPEPLAYTPSGRQNSTTSLRHSTGTVRHRPDDDSSGVHSRADARHWGNLRHMRATSCNTAVTIPNHTLLASIKHTRAGARK